MKSGLMNYRTLIVFALVIGPCAATARPAASATPSVQASTAKSPSSLLAKAKRVFLINEAPGPSATLPFRDLQSELRNWKQFSLVDEASSADITISLTTGTVERPVMQTGPQLGAKLANPKSGTRRSTLYTLTVRHRATGEVLWSGASESVVAALQPLRSLMSASPGVCVVVWCW